MNVSEPTWGVDEHYEGVIRRGRRLRRRQRGLVGFSSVGALVLVVLAVGLQTRPHAREVQSVAGPPVVNPAASWGEVGSSTTLPVDTTTVPAEAALSSVPAVTAPVAPSASGADTATAGPSAVGQPVSPATSPPPTTPSPTAQPPAPTTIPPSHVPVTISLTQADGNKSVVLGPRDRLVVQLSGQSADYSEPESSDQGVLQTGDGAANPDGSAQASFLAVADGQSAVHYWASPKCRKATPACGASTQGYTITVSVVG